MLFPLLVLSLCVTLPCFSLEIAILFPTTPSPSSPLRLLTTQIASRFFIIVCVVFFTLPQVPVIIVVKSNDDDVFSRTFALARKAIRARKEGKGVGVGAFRVPRINTTNASARRERGEGRENFTLAKQRNKQSNVTQAGRSTNGIADSHRGPLVYIITRYK